MLGGIQVTRARTSLIWVESFGELLTGADPGLPMAFLGRESTFTSHFAEALAGKQENGLQPPWPHPQGQLFWTYYLERKAPAGIKPTRAWSMLVPLRGRAPVPVTMASGNQRVVAETFFHPHAAALVVTIEDRTVADLEGFLDGLESRQQGGLTWTGSAGKPKQGGIGKYASDCMKALRLQVVGNANDGVPPPPRFSITVVVSGGGVDEAQPIEPNGDVHRALTAMAHGGLDGWRVGQLESLQTALLPLRGLPPPGHALFSTRRGRVIWAPRDFSNAALTKKLICYHRNLTYAALQIESLCGLASLLVHRLESGATLTATENDCMRNVAGLLGRLYAGRSETTYRSMSIRRHIVDRGVAEANVLRKRFKMDELPAT
ncbi:MAG TPA: hypothetical protein VK550_04270 [Polyangiaceae bacterium]|nr:hypothetical protein [Polyangiaceae bacterium]